MYDSVALRFMTGDRHPDHDTIAHCRKRFLVALEGLFLQILVVARAMGVFKSGTVSVVENHLSQCAHDQREIGSILTGLERVESQLGKAEH